MRSGFYEQAATSDGEYIRGTFNNLTSTFREVLRLKRSDYPHTVGVGTKDGTKHGELTE